MTMDVDMCDKSLCATLEVVINPRTSFPHDTRLKFIQWKYQSWMDSYEYHSNVSLIRFFEKKKSFLKQSRIPPKSFALARALRNNTTWNIMNIFLLYDTNTEMLNKACKVCVWQPSCICTIYLQRKYGGGATHPWRLTSTAEVADHVTWRRLLIGWGQDTVDDVTRQGIFSPQSNQTKVGRPPSMVAVISLNCDRYLLRWRLGWANVHCLCRDLSVSSLNPVNSCFWQTNWAAELAKWSSKLSRSRRNAALVGTCPYSLFMAYHHRYVTNFLTLDGHMFLKSCWRRDCII